MNLFGKVTQGQIRTLQSALDGLMSEIDSLKSQQRKHHGRLLKHENELKDLRTTLNSLGEVVLAEEGDDMITNANGQRGTT